MGRTINGQYYCTAKESSTRHEWANREVRKRRDATRLVWKVEFEIDASWVADGFDPCSFDFLEALSGMLPYANMETELDAKIVKAPTGLVIRRMQGYDK